MKQASGWLLVLAVVHATGCANEDTCLDEDDRAIACEPLDDVPEVADAPDPVESLDEIGGTDLAADFAPGPDDLDGVADEALAVPVELDPTAYGELAHPGGGRTALAPGRSKNAERRRFLPVGRTAGARRYVVMRLQPGELPDLADGDRLRAAAELQLTTRCDIGQSAPGCGYNPHVRLQLVLSGDRDGTNPQGAGTIALSGVKSFDCSKDDHHCVKTIDFSDATATLHHASAPCVATSSCFVNLVAWAYNSDARSNGQDVLLLGANEGDFLQNHDIEQDRGRIMALRERGNVGADDVELRETPHDVKSGPITFASNGDEKRIYSHTLNHGHPLRAGEKYLVWADVEASANGRVNLSLEMFLTRNRNDHNGGAIDGTHPKAISEHNGTNCSPGNDCHLRKVAAFSVDHDLPGPVYVNIAASTEVPGPGSATTTVHDTGFIKVLRYAQ